MATKKNDEIVEVRPLDMAQVTLHIVGDTPLIVHCWSEKAKRQMLEAQMGLAKGKKKPVKNPVEDFINSMYWLTEKPTEMTEEAFEEAIAKGARFGFPVVGLKKAAISAAYRMGWSKDKVSLQGAFFLYGVGQLGDSGLDMLEIISDPPIMREDMVKVGLGTADLRYRGEFRNWSTDVILKYNKNGLYSLENIVNMINAAGMVCGIGEWRVEKSGQNGMFRVV